MDKSIFTQQASIVKIITSGYGHGKKSTCCQNSDIARAMWTLYPIPKHANYSNERQKTKTYTIDQAGLRIESVSKHNLSNERHVSFENIKREKFFHTERATLLLLAGGLLFFLWVMVAISSPRDTEHYYVVLVIIGVVSLSCFVCYFLYRPRFYFVKTFSGAFIKFQINKNAEDVNDFVKALIAKRDIYLRTRYGTPNLHLSCDSQFSNFHIMHREGILSTSELESNVSELNKLFGQTTPTIRFQGYSKN